MNNCLQLFVSFLFLFQLFSCSTTPNQTPKGTDTLPVEFRNALTDLAKKDVLNTDSKLALSILSDLEKKYADEKSPQIQAFINAYKAKCYFVQYNLDSALAISQKTCDYFKANQETYKEQYINALQVLALVYREKSDILQARQLFEEVLYLINNNPELYAQDPKNYDFVGQFYGNLGNLYGDEHEYKKARECTKKAIYYLSKSTKNVNALLVRNYLNLGVFFEADAVDSALYYTKIGMMKTNPSDSIAKIRGYEYLGQFYLHATQGDSAVKYLNAALEYSKQLEGLDEKMIYNLLVQAFTKKGDKKNADFYYNLTKESIIKSHQNDANFDDLLIIKKALTFAIDHNKYNDIKQLATFYNNLADTLYSQEKANALKDLEVKYQVKAKDDNIQKLKIENELKESQLKQRTAILLLFVMTGLVAYFFIRQRQLKQKNEKVELQQRFLRSQMNPHFMSNALSAIQLEILNGNSKLANKYLNKYAELTRNIFENSRDKYIPIYNEVKVIENYLLLQKIRFGEKFDYTLNLYPDIEDDEVMIPPMLIQPSIENAIEHGFKNITYKGELVISIAKEENTIIASIQDNGAGMNILPNSNGKKSLSSSITAERLEMLAKETKKPAGINIEIVKPHGVVVTLTIPY